MCRPAWRGRGSGVCGDSQLIRCCVSVRQTTTMVGRLSVRSFSIPRTRSTTIARPGSPLAACLRSRKVLAARMGRSAKVSRMGMPAFDKNKKMSANAASGKPQSAQASGSAIKKAAPKKKVEKKKASFKGDTFAGKPSKKA